MTFSLVGLIIATLLLICYKRFLHDRKKKGSKLSHLKELPGPKGIPIFGNVLQLGKIPNDTFTKWSKEYGPIYKVQLGNQLSVIVSDAQLCKEIFTTDPAFAGRPHFGTDLYEETPGLGMFLADGPHWETHRRFLIRQLRDFGFGKSSMETLIMEEANEVIEKFKDMEGSSVGNVRCMLRLAIVNALWRIMSTQRFQHDDPKLGELVEGIVHHFDNVFSGGALLIFLPWLKYVLPEYSGYNGVRKVMDKWKVFLEGTIREHKDTFQEENLKDFIDVYLAEVRKTSDEKSHFYGEKAERQLAATMMDLFIAGSDTSASTLSWTIVYLCKFPQIQEKLQQEIEAVTGNTKQVSLSDRPWEILGRLCPVGETCVLRYKNDYDFSMPYTQALVDEILRHSTITPDGAQHRAMAEREFHGYRIPEGAWIQPNIFYIHRDPKNWGDPENFRPERFLSEDGKNYKKSENLQPFQVGRRVCVGETLARDTIFLYLTNIFQKFEMKFDSKTNEPSLETIPGFFRNPEDYSVLMVDRLSMK